MSGKPAAGGGNASGGSANGGQDHTSIVLEYLLKRGYHGAASALKSEIEGNSGAGSSGNAGAAASTPNKGTAPQETLERRNLGKKNAIREDPLPWTNGLFGLRDFVYGSLDIHRPELLPILLPVYVHSFMDLIMLNYRDLADSIFGSFASDYASTNPTMVQLLASLRTPAQIQESEQANRWKRERYVVRMTRRGWSLLLGWLQGGGRGLGLGGASGELSERGREKMLGIINERVKVEIIEGKPGALPRQARIADGGLESELAVDVDAAAGSKAGQPVMNVKLGPMPPDPKLDREVQRILQAEGSKQGSPTKLNGTDSEMGGAASASTSQLPGQPAPLDPILSSDLPPYPPSFRTVDVKREVEKVREERKRIRLGPVSSTSASNAADSESLSAPLTVSQAKYNLPSVCMFTIHDSGDTLISTEFSDDSTLLAGGFSESYIRLWNLKGDPLEGVRSDFDSSNVSSSSDLAKLKQKKGAAATGSSTQKLIGHSGPVYSTSFDPLPGPSGPPRYLLSSSQDATVRLWSLDTYTNIVAYRGHRDPIWDVEWGPRGVYFATASRDRTARLWTTERVAAVRIFAGHLSDVDCVRFHPNSLYLATGSSDRTCRLWDVQRGSCMRVFVGHSGAVSTLAMSPDGRYLASGGDDCAINLWDLGSGRLVKSMPGHTARVQSLSFSAESSVLVSGGADCSVRVWDVKSSQTTSTAVHSTSGHAQNGTNSAFSGNKERDTSDGSDLLVSIPTKRTPIFTTKFTPRNLCLAAGPIF